MELNKQVVSLELAQKLKELGVKRGSIFYWREFETPDTHRFWDVDFEMAITRTGYATIQSIHAYTVAELGEMLPSYEEWVTASTPDNPPEGDSSGMLVFTSFYNGKWQVEFDKETYIEHIIDLPIFREDTEADARAKMLVYLLENKLITIAYD